MLCGYAHVYGVDRHTISYQLKPPSPKLSWLDVNILFRCKSRRPRRPESDAVLASFGSRTGRGQGSSGQAKPGANGPRRQGAAESSAFSLGVDRKGGRLH